MTEPTDRARRPLIVGVIPTAVLAAIALPQLLLADRLPDPLAVHWGLSGSPNGSMASTVSFLLLVGMWAMFWALLTIGARRSLPASPVVAFVFFAGGLLVAIQWWIVERNLDVAVWSAARDLSWPRTLSAVAAGIVLGGVGWVLAGGRAGIPQAMRPGTDGEPPTAGLLPGEPGTWSATTTNRILWAVALATLVAIVFVPAPVRIVLLVVAVLVAAFSTVRVDVGEDGVALAFGLAGWPRQRIPLDAIDRADVVEVDPMAYGGWGYRVVAGTVSGTTAVVLRRGEGLGLSRPGKRDFVVTVDDAATAAGVVNDLIARTGRRPGAGGAPAPPQR
jgi:hypothetical protein